MAVNVRLIGGFLSDLASTSASSTASGYDSDNVVMLDRTSLWKASASGAASITLDLGSAKTVSAIGLANHNGGAWTGGKLERSSDNSNWTTVVSFTSMVTGEDYFHTFTGASYQYWKVSVTGSTAAMQIGVFYLGTPITLTYNPWVGQSTEDVYNVETATAQSGQTVTEEWGRRLLRTSMAWDVVETTAKDQVRDFLRTEGGPLRPFWYVPRDDSTSNVYGRAYLVRAVDGTFKASEIFGGLWSMSVTVQEVV